jgi:hypothetical protein
MTHAAGYNFYSQAIHSKIDGIQHASSDRVLTPDLVSFMASQKQHSTPTMELAKLIIGLSNPKTITGFGVGLNSSYDA